MTDADPSTPAIFDPVERCTNLPFGDWQACTNSISPLHFTGKQRDTETDNDYFGARYYISRHGRWLTPDWSARAEAVPYASLANPQTLNLYAYVGNNPVSTADADGHCSVCSRRGNGGEFIAGWHPWEFDITLAANIMYPGIPKPIYVTVYLPSLVYRALRAAHTSNPTRRFATEIPRREDLIAVRLSTK